MMKKDLVLKFSKPILIESEFNFLRIFAAFFFVFLFKSGTAKYDENVSFWFSVFKVDSEQTVVNEVVHFLFLKQAWLIKVSGKSGIRLHNEFKTN